MARKTVYIPDLLNDELERLGAGENLSREFQDYLRARVAAPARSGGVLPRSFGAATRSAEVKPMTKKDVARVAELWRAMTVEAGNRPTDQEKREIKLHLEKIPGNAWSFGLVARLQSGRIVGFLTGRMLDHPTMPGIAAELEELYVERRARGRGVGTALLLEASRMAKQFGASVMRAFVDQAGDAKGNGNAGVFRKTGWSPGPRVFYQRL